MKPLLCIKIVLIDNITYTHFSYHYFHRYHNKENSVISALLAEVHAKASVVTSQVDEGLFYKLRSYFPTTDSDTIRQLLAK